MLMTLTDLLDEKTRADLAATYGPAWQVVAINGHFAVTEPDWGAMTPAEREWAREEIMRHWNAELRIAEDEEEIPPGPLTIALGAGGKVIGGNNANTR